jgi:hypothetical protein
MDAWKFRNTFVKAVGEGILLHDLVSKRSDHPAHKGKRTDRSMTKERSSYLQQEKINLNFLGFCENVY